MYAVDPHEFNIFHGKKWTKNKIYKTVSINADYFCLLINCVLFVDVLSILNKYSPNKLWLKSVTFNRFSIIFFCRCPVQQHECNWLNLSFVCPSMTPAVLLVKYSNWINSKYIRWLITWFNCELWCIFWSCCSSCFGHTHATLHITYFFLLLWK